MESFAFGDAMPAHKESVSIAPAEQRPVNTGKLDEAPTASPFHGLRTISRGIKQSPLREGFDGTDRGSSVSFE